MHAQPKLLVSLLSLPKQAPKKEDLLLQLEKKKKTTQTQVQSNVQNRHQQEGCLFSPPPDPSLL